MKIADESYEVCQCGHHNYGLYLYLNGPKRACLIATWDQSVWCNSLLLPEITVPSRVGSDCIIKCYCLKCLIY